MFHSLFVNLMHINPFYVMFAWKLAAFAAMVYFLFITTYAEINAAAAAFPEAIM